MGVICKWTFGSHIDIDIYRYRSYHYITIIYQLNLLILQIVIVMFACYIVSLLYCWLATCKLLLTMVGITAEPLQAPRPEPTRCLLID